MNQLKFSDSFYEVSILLKKILLAHLFFLGMMSLFRFIFFLEFSGNTTYLASDLLAAAFMGLRLDAIVIGYIQVPLTLVLILLYILRSRKLLTLFSSFASYYLIVLYLFASMLIGSDFGYFSFFNEHITLMIYGILDDDTSALWRTMQDNYNITLILFAIFIYSAFIYLTIKKIMQRPVSSGSFRLSLYYQAILVLLFVVFNIMIIRGTFGMQPLSKVIPDVSKNNFVNELSNNGVLAFIKATKLYKKSKSGKYDLIKTTQYKGKIHEAFAYLTQREVSKNSEYIQAITHKVPPNNKIDTLRPHVVVIMVESFGLPIVDYQSQTFNILGRLKKHFDEDTLFTNFISASNGTIVSLEPLILNTTARPNSTSLGQSKYQYTSFEQAAAKVYEKAGYETHFVYGGDLKWRNIGKFISLQGFQHQAGKVHISSALGIDIHDSSHDWGLFDEHSYDYILKTLKEAKTPQFIFLLTTNNHPPFTVPKTYKAKPLECNGDLKACMIGDKELIQRRLQDYQYAVDMAGRFMDNIKQSDLREKSVIAITADNNTIEGRIRYKDQISTSKKIPFYLYAPESIRIKGIDTKVASSHKDLFPTLYHQSLSNIEYAGVGKNLFDPTKRHCGFNDSGIVISSNGAFKHHKAEDDIQKACEKEYDAALAVSDWLIRIYPKEKK